jgi:hypothetical protein
MILAGKLHQAGWYKDLPPDWAVALSDNGWTTDELGFEWVKHFNRHTESRTQGAYRLLILDGHSSHATPELINSARITRLLLSACLLTPPTSSSLLMLAATLKVLYGHEVSELARQGVFHIDKLDFLWIYQRLRQTALFAANVKAGFEATGLIPPCPDRVLSNLTVIRTPSPLGTAGGISASWTAETPRTTTQLKQQARLVQRLLQRQSQSPTSQPIAQLVKSCQPAMNSATILAEENPKLRAANARQRRKGQYNDSI